MPNFYPYLISSLPMLHYGARPPFSFARFLEICQDKISSEELRLIKLAQEGYAYEGAQPTLKRWAAWETGLRNELVKIRAARKHLDANKYIREEDFTQSYIVHVALSASRHPVILEAERILDQARWQAQEELAVGHYFDLDALMVYALKLLILERWEKINNSEKAGLLEEALG